MQSDPHREIVVIDQEDATSGLSGLAAGSFDCVLFGDVLQRLADPEAALRAASTLLADHGVVAVCVPNFGHHAIVKSLLRSDFAYQPSATLDTSLYRFFTHATFIKLMLDAGLLPELVYATSSGGIDDLLDAATPLLKFFRVDPTRARKFLDADRFLFVATALADVTDRFASSPLTFVACVNDEDQLSSNLLRSPCLRPGTPHELILRRGETSAAAGFHAGLAAAKHDLVVFVQQDMYLPRGWDSRFVDQFRAAEEQLGPIGVAGAFGLRVVNREREFVGRVMNQETLLDEPIALPARVDSLDEIVLAVHRVTDLQFDPTLGFHLYGLDVCLSAQQHHLAVAVLDIPCFHNSLFAHTDSAYHDARERMIAKWPDVDPLWSCMGELRAMAPAGEAEVAPVAESARSWRTTAPVRRVREFARRLRSHHN